MDVPTSNPTMGIDPQGRHYVDMPGRGRIYVSPEAFGEKGPTDQGGFTHTRPTFNTETGNYDSGIDWGNLMSVGVGGALTGGILSAVLAGGSPAASAAAAATPLEEGGAGAAIGTGAAATPTATSGASSILGKAGWTGATKLADVLTHAGAAGQEQENKSDVIKNSAERNKLDREKYALVAPGQRLHDSTIASLTSNVTPTRVNWGPEGFHPGAGLRGEIPHFEGGFTGGLEHLDPATRALSKLVMQDELASQQRGGSTGGNHDLDSPDLNVNNPSGTDRALGSAGLSASILAALYGGRNKATTAASNPAGTDYPDFWEANG